MSGELWGNVIPAHVQQILRKTIRIWNLFCSKELPGKAEMKKNARSVQDVFSRCSYLIHRVRSECGVIPSGSKWRPNEDVAKALIR